jgi:hypothetical protein
LDVFVLVLLSDLLVELEGVETFDYILAASDVGWRGLRGTHDAG